MTNFGLVKQRRDLKRSLKVANNSTSAEIDNTLTKKRTNKLKQKLKKNLKKQRFKSYLKPNDWVLGKDGKYIWDENVTSSTDKDLNGREYIGSEFNLVKKHFEENNSWLSRNIGSKRGGLNLFVNSNSYYDSKIPKIVQDVYNRYIWKHNLKNLNDNRLDNEFQFDKNNVNNDLKILFPDENIDVKGELYLDGIGYKYTANINTSAINTTGLKLVDYFNEHPRANATLARIHSGKIKGEYFAITNKQVYTDIPVISVYFNNKKDYKYLINWFLKYGNKYKNEIEENPW